VKFSLIVTVLVFFLVDGACAGRGGGPCAIWFAAYADLSTFY
jgi:hypothetical protein